MVVVAIGSSTWYSVHQRMCLTSDPGFRRTVYDAIWRAGWEKSGLEIAGR